MEMDISLLNYGQVKNCFNERWCDTAEFERRLGKVTLKLVSEVPKIPVGPSAPIPSIFVL